MTARNQTISRAAHVLLAALAGVYLLQLATPLRLNTDAYRLLSMAVSAYEGRGFLVDGQPDQFPVGYPLVVLGLLRAGLGNSTVLVLLNLLSLAVALLLIWWLLKRSGFDAHRRLAVALATLLSWVVVKHVTLPVSDLTYLGLSMACLASLHVFWTREGHTKWMWFVAGALLAAGAIAVRTVGLALIPALALSLLHRDHWPLGQEGQARGSLRNLLVLALALVLIGAASFLGIMRTDWFQAQFVQEGSYLANLQRAAGQDTLAAIVVKNVRYRLLEYGEVFGNLPVNKVVQATGILHLVGTAGWLAVLLGCYHTYRRLLPATGYFIAYCALMLGWPYYDSRFWLPVIPLMATFALETAGRIYAQRPRRCWLLRAYGAYFLALGLVALSFSTRISLSGRGFSEVYGDGTDRMTYRYALDNGRPVDTREVDAGKVRLLAIFEPRVSPQVKECPN